MSRHKKLDGWIKAHNKTHFSLTHFESVYINVSESTNRDMKTNQRLFLSITASMKNLLGLIQEGATLLVYSEFHSLGSFKCKDRF